MRPSTQQSCFGESDQLWEGGPIRRVKQHAIEFIKHITPLSLSLISNYFKSWKDKPGQDDYVRCDQETQSKSHHFEQRKKKNSISFSLSPSLFTLATVDAYKKTHTYTYTQGICKDRSFLFL